MMNTQGHRPSSSEAESGQAAALVALLLFFAFLAFAALAIDGAMTYSVRRDLQNVADSAALAACRVIANNDTSGGTVGTTALNAAQNSIIAHLGSLTPYVTPNVGTGVGLVKGIEISTQEVRVAVMRQIPTVLTQFTGRGSSFINAQARCDARSGGGLMPIAVRRWDGVGGTQVDYVARQGAPPYSSDSITVTWTPGRYGPAQVPVPCGNPGAPACTGGVDYTASDANPGPIVEILGQGALPNSGKSSYNNFVMPDIRDVASGSPEYYHDATGNPNTDKDISQRYIYRGYPGPYFIPGEQMAILDGASASFEAHSVVDAGYRVGDTVAVMVYDGNVWDTPDFEVNLTPQSNNGIADAVRPVDETTAVKYTVNIAKTGSASWSTPLIFNLHFKLSEAASGSCGSGIQMGLKVGSNPVMTLTPNSSTYSYTAPNVTQAAGWTGTLFVWTTDPTTTVPSCISGLNLIAVSSLGLDKGTSSHFGFADPPTTPLPARYYTVRSGKAPSSGPGIITIQQGASVKPTLNLTTFGFSSSNFTCGSVPVTAAVLSSNGMTTLPWTTFFPIGDQTTNVDIKRNSNENPPTNYSLDALATAPVGSYILRFSVAPPDSGQCADLETRELDVPLSIEPPPGGTSTPKNFVVFQGYAVFRITNFTPNMSNPNTVWGRAISPLYKDLSEITYGLQPRLVPWN